jgi:ABC-type branched-subunit amino acid transport system substrate-binding protein
MSRLALRIVSIAAIFSLLLVACQPAAAPSGGGQAAPSGDQTAEACTITFGAAVSLTGKTAKEGGYIKDGYELYKDEINKAGGFKVGDRVMVLKRGENVGDRYIRHTTEQEVLQIIVSGTRDTAITADQALAKLAK